jgi:hypothetical protein
MSSRLNEMVREFLERLGRLTAKLAGSVPASYAAVCRLRKGLVMAVLLAALACGLYVHPPFAAIHRGEMLVRTDVLDGSVDSRSASIWQCAGPSIQPASRRCRKNFLTT